MMKYDVTIVLKATEDPKTAEAKYKALFEKDGLKVSDSQNWGKKVLAYPVRKQSEGIYLSMQLTGKVDPKKINARFKLDETVLRTLILANKVKEKISKLKS